MICVDGFFFSLLVSLHGMISRKAISLLPARNIWSQLDSNSIIRFEERN